MKYLRYHIATLMIAGLAATSCDKDGETIYVDGVTDTSVETTAMDVVLDENRLDMLALTVYWNDNGEISLSDPLVAAPKYAFTNTFQLSAYEDFSQCYEETLPDGVCSRQFSCAELNSAAIRGGMESGSTATVYVRLKSVLGVNIAPRYSNVIKFNLTTYMVDMTTGIILDTNRNDSGRTLALTERENVYAGFFGASSWENWFFRSPAGEIWGTAADPGLPFVLGKESAGEIWNLWFPEPAGCYYTEINIPANEWTALLITELNIGGDIEGAMSYDRKSNVWSYTFNADARTYNITLSGQGSQYNASTGTDAPLASQTVAFGGDAQDLTFGSTASTIAVPVNSAGEVTLVLDLSNPKKWTIGAGELAPVEDIPACLYLPGIVDPWGFDDFLTLYDEDNKCYAAVHYVNSAWGYQVAIEKDNWGDIYTMADGGNAFEGKLEFQGSNNVAASDEGIYLMDFSLGWMTYKVTKVTSVSYTGLNDDWNFHAMTQSADDPCVFTAEMEKTANTPWGVKVIINENWDLFFGGNGTVGELRYGKDGFEGDNELGNGTLILTVDLAKGTYNYTKK